MLNLFSNLDIETKAVAGVVPDLLFIENYITDVEHDNLIIDIDQNIWSNELKRRVQHYGYKYDYRARNINIVMKVNDLPKWATMIGEKLTNNGYFTLPPDQLIVNEYMPGQGITDHIDCEPCFEDTIISISLGSYTTMNFTNKFTNEKIPVVLPPKSAVILKGESRYGWTHGIPSRKSDTVNGIKIRRSRRISLTFRRVILEHDNH